MVDLALAVDPLLKKWTKHAVHIVLCIRGLGVSFDYDIQMCSVIFPAALIIFI